MYRNGSYAYYSCHFDYLFEDTGLPTRVLFCEYDTYWNGSVPRCVCKLALLAKIVRLPIKIECFTMNGLILLLSNTARENVTETAFTFAHNGDVDDDEKTIQVAHSEAVQMKRFNTGLLNNKRNFFIIVECFSNWFMILFFLLKIL